MDVKIYINSVEIDLMNDISIPLTMSIADIRQPEKRDTTWSKTVILPGTQDNNQLFGHLWNINSSVNSSGTTNFNPSFNPSYKASAIITRKDSVQFTGIMQLLNINVLDNYEIEYEVAFVGELVNIFQTIENRTLSSLDLSAYDHLYTKQNQIDSLDYSIKKNGASYPFTLGEGYVYPMIDYGYNNTIDWNVRHLFPAVYLKTITDAIFNEAGFQVQSSFFDSDLYKRLIIPFSGGSTLKLTDAQIADRTFRASSTSTQTKDTHTAHVSTVISMTDDSTPPNNDAGGVYGSNIFTVAKSGTYGLTFKPKVSVTHFPSANTTLNGTNPVIGHLRLVSNLQGVIGSVQVRLCSGSALATTISVLNGGSTVTSGTTTLETTGEVSGNYTLSAGEQIYCDLYNVGATPAIYSTGSNTTSNFVRININTGTTFYAQLTDVNLQEGDTVEINSILPQKYKQSELLQSIIKMFNLFVQQDKLIPNKLYIEPQPSFYSLGSITDLSEKLDESKDVKIIPMGDLDTKRYIFNYKKDEDYYNSLYYDEYSEVYGEKKLDVDNDFLKGEIKNEVIFSPTPLVNTFGHDRILSKIFSVDEQGVISPRASNIRLLYYAGVKTSNQAYNYIATSGTTVLQTYGYAGHLDNPTQPTIDLSFGVPREVFYLTDYYTANNIFNVYWKAYFDGIIDKNSKIVEAFFRLNELDINTLDFRNSFYFKNEYWRLNKVVDYDPTNNLPTKCEFIRLKATPPYVADTSNPVKGGVISYAGDTMPNQTNRTTSNQSGGIRSFGMNNNLPSIGNGILVTGSNNNVGFGAENVTILGSSGVTVLGGLSNVTLVNSNNVTVTESNTHYVNGVQVSTNTPKVYKALLTQTGTAAPVATVLANTLSGTPVWSYDYVGGYILTLASAFPTGKTLMYISTKNTGSQSCVIAEGDGLNTILVDTVDLSGTGVNGVLTATSITIEVFP